MCQVQRVKNSCGHYNDHVRLACNYGKSESLDRKNVDSVILSDRHDLLDGDESVRPSPGCSFNACNQPYCRGACIRYLKSSQGFKCMVAGCEKAN